jgi:hypothetical protein
LATREAEIDDLRHERLLRRPYCEKRDQLLSAASRSSIAIRLR